MRPELLYLALAVGAANWAFRVLPMWLPLPHATGPLGRFISATGPAAIATLFVASLMPEVKAGADPVPLLAGVAAVLAVFAWRRAVALATVAGAVAYGLAVALSL